MTPTMRAADCGTESDIVGGGHWDLLPGQWTDDTSMALCLADSLVNRRGFDADDQLTQYVRWWREGRWSCRETCFDIGTTEAAEACACYAGLIVGALRVPGRRGCDGRSGATLSPAARPGKV